MKKVCIFIEQQNGVLTSNSQKVLFMAQNLKIQYGYMVIIVAFEENINEFITSLEDFDKDIIYYIKFNRKRRYFFTQNEISNLVCFLKRVDPDILWACNSFCYKMLFPKIAYILKTGLCAACLDFTYNEASHQIDMIRMAYSGNAYVQIAVQKSRPLMATILADSKRYILNRGLFSPTIHDITSDIITSELKTVEFEAVKVVKNVCQNESKIVIGIGNGIRNKSDVLLFNRLAYLLNNAAIGGTRELVNRQIIPQSCQIGSTGIRIYADLYIAFGISGAPQHIQGIEHVKKIISINSDPYAAMFQYSDYGVVGDLFEVVQYMINFLEGKCNL